MGGQLVAEGKPVKEGEEVLGGEVGESRNLSSEPTERKEDGGPTGPGLNS